ncbi:MAG: hypothetical protein methR_P0633 [Methyloprofundus sp.]|nr:MAG: hypothetical protein methR_P0633 [Methyloprofundus sp.]
MLARTKAMFNLIEQYRNPFDKRESFFPPSLNYLLLSVFISFSLTLTACQESTSTQVSETELNAPPIPESIPAEFVILIDNSRSIRPTEQQLIRETTMLFADMIGLKDRISVLTFGTAAKQVTTTLINTDNDRVKFKDTIKRQLKFNENYSDIRAGIKLLAEQQSILFPTPKAIKVAIVLSDGKLEPKNKKIEQAFQDIQQNIAELDPNIKMYAVVLGDTASNHTIPGLKMTGKQLMAEKVASSSELFFQAKQLDQILDTAITILKKTKGISAFGDNKETTYRIDDTVETMTLIVRKLHVDGTNLATSTEIQLNAPTELENSDLGSAEQYDRESIYRSNDYQYFDLFVISNPRPGNWSVSLSNGKEPSVLNAINSPIDLRSNFKTAYYLNEIAALQAWIADAKSKQISQMSYQIQAHILNAQISGQERNNNTDIYIPLQFDTKTGQYFLIMPSDLTEPLNLNAQAANISIELIAQKFINNDSNSLDPWFIRRSRPLPIIITEPIIQWFTSDSPQLRYPIIDHSIHFGGTLNTNHTDYQQFDVPPKLTLIIEQFDQESNQYQSISNETILPDINEGELVYNFNRNFSEYGNYRYYYQLTGTTKGGEKTIQSRWFNLQINFPWIYAGALIFLILILANIISSLTAKIRGQIQIETDAIPAEFESVRLRPKRAFDSRQIKEVNLGTAHFRINAQRRFFVIKRLRIEMLSGQATIDHLKLQKGKAIQLKTRGNHEMDITHENGHNIHLTMTLHL